MHIREPGLPALWFLDRDQLPTPPCTLFVSTPYYLCQTTASICMPRISITVKNALVYFVLMVVSSTTLGFAIYKLSSRKVLENATLSLNHNNETAVLQFKTFLEDIQKDVWFLSKKWYFDKIYNNYITNWLFAWCYKLFFVLDVYLFEIFGPRGIVFLLSRSARYLSFLQTGSIFFYLIIMVLSGFALFFLF